MDCGCKWDGNLNGKLRRCRVHNDAFKLERKLRREANKWVRQQMKEHHES